MRGIEMDVRKISTRVICVFNVNFVYATSIADGSYFFEVSGYH